VGQNILTDIETGDIKVYAVDRPLTQIANNSHDITSLQNYSAQWQIMIKEKTATPDAMRGTQNYAGKSYALGALESAQANSLFELMTENKGLHIEEMMRKFILPYLKKKMDTAEEISATLEEQQITQIDSIYVPNKAVKKVNQKIIDTVLAGQAYPQEQQRPAIEAEKVGIQAGLNQFGNQRFFKPSDISSKTWKEYFKDFEWEVDVDVTNEQSDKRMVLETLNGIFQTIANPNTAAILQTPQGKLVFNKILEEMGNISPLELSNLKAAQPTLVGGSAVPINNNQNATGI
jgi:hypothetical protein